MAGRLQPRYPDWRPFPAHLRKPRAATKRDPDDSIMKAALTIFLCVILFTNHKTSARRYETRYPSTFHDAAKTSILLNPGFLGYAGRNQAVQLRLRGAGPPQEEPVLAEDDQSEDDNKIPEFEDYRSRGTHAAPEWARDKSDPDNVDLGKLAATCKWPGYGEPLGDGKWRLVTTRMEACDAGAEYGIFFDVEAKNKSILVSGLRCAAHGLSNPELAWRQIEVGLQTTHLFSTARSKTPDNRLTFSLAHSLLHANNV
jgi:hypothetical protein